MYIEKRRADQTIPLQNINIQDSFWSPYVQLVREVVVPYQWEAINDRIAGAEPSHAIRNLKIAAGEETGEFYGMVFQDTDVAKWLEAVGYLLQTGPDPELEQLADDVIDLIGRAQRADGYLNTYYTLKEPGNEWTNLCECHELYTAGHFIEAAVAYVQATGKKKILDIVCRLADYIDTVFGPEPGKINGYDGHQEIELALVKLYRITGNQTYLRLSQYFLEARGHGDFYLEEYEKRGKTRHWYNANMIFDKKYSQTHLPIREQYTAEGHAVRAVYMASAMADVAFETGDSTMLEACRRLWSNMVHKRMYITGGIGSMAFGEAFSLDYDLPSDTAYAETCASIGLIFFAHRMLKLEPKGSYADVLERALYNTVIAGMAKDGKHFFYVNPLEVWPEACAANHIYEHVKPVRQGWFGCACCPPNIARLLASLGEYIYTVKEETVYNHLYIGGKAELQVKGQSVIIEQDSKLPWDGNVRLTVTPQGARSFTLALRVPSWTDGAVLLINGTAVDWSPHCVDGYAHISREWSAGDQVEFILSMPILRIKGHPLLRDTVGKVALQRGPLVYCLEQADNGSNLHQIRLPRDAQGSAVWRPELLGGVQVLNFSALRDLNDSWGEELYKASGEMKAEQAAIQFIPYYIWANREMGEMSVWIRE
jgi:uncharacterized protein